MPAYNHTRGYSFRTPCPLCKRERRAELLKQKREVSLIRREARRIECASIAVIERFLARSLKKTDEAQGYLTRFRKQFRRELAEAKRA